MHSCGSWTIKKAEHWRVDAFKLVLEKTLESPLDSKEIKPVSSKEINPEYSLEGLMLKLKLQYLGHVPHSSVGKESACNAGDPGLIPGSGKSSGEGNGNPLQYSCLENLMDGAW